MAAIVDLIYSTVSLDARTSVVAGAVNFLAGRCDVWYDGGIDRPGPARSRTTERGSTMKKLLVAAACAALVGCDYTVPLAKGPAGEADAALVGLWQRTQNGQPENLVVLPLGRQELLVAYPATSKDAMYARAWSARGAGLSLIQLQWIGTGQGAVPDDAKVFQLAAYTITGDTLTIRTINPDVAGGASKSPEDLARALDANKGNEDSRRPEMVFTRAKK